MLVKLANPWFSPTEKISVGDKHGLSGQLFSAGEHTMPDWLYVYLPKSAEVIVKPDNMEGVATMPRVKVDTYKDHDLERLSVEQMEKANRKALAAAKAREALAAKRAAAKAAETLEVEE